MDAGAAAHAFVADVDRPVLEPDDRHHLARVLRLRAGDTITVADGHGRWRHCGFGDELVPLDDVVEDPVPEPELAVGFALTKGEKPEWVVQKLTEIGVDRIVPFVAARSVVRWDGERAARNHERLATVVRMAGMQCRRARLPVLEPVTSFDDVAGRDASALADPGGGPIDAGVRIVLVGPEGGFDDRERASHPRGVILGPHVLRSETAAVVAATLLVALRSGVVNRAGGHVR